MPIAPALFTALTKGDETNIESLLLAEPDINADVGGEWATWSILMLAVRHAHLKAVQLLVTDPRFKDKVDVNYCNKAQDTALIWACCAYYEPLKSKPEIAQAMAQILSSHPKININQIDSNGYSALSMALSWDLHKVVEALLRASPPQPLLTLQTINQRNTNDQTPLYLALAQSNQTCVLLLLKLGANATLANLQQAVDSRKDAQKQPMREILNTFAEYQRLSSSMATLSVEQAGRLKELRAKILDYYKNVDSEEDYVTALFWYEKSFSNYVRLKCFNDCKEIIDKIVSFTKLDPKTEAKDSRCEQAIAQVFDVAVRMYGVFTESNHFTDEQKRILLDILIPGLQSLANLTPQMTKDLHGLQRQCVQLCPNAADRDIRYQQLTAAKNIDAWYDWGQDLEGSKETTHAIDKYSRCITEAIAADRVDLLFQTCERLSAIYETGGEAKSRIEKLADQVAEYFVVLADKCPTKKEYFNRIQPAKLLGLFKEYAAWQGAARKFNVGHEQLIQEEQAAAKRAERKAALESQVKPMVVTGEFNELLNLVNLLAEQKAEYEATVVQQGVDAWLKVNAVTDYIFTDFTDVRSVSDPAKVYQVLLDAYRRSMAERIAQKNNQGIYVLCNRLHDIQVGLKLKSAMFSDQCTVIDTIITQQVVSYFKGCLRDTTQPLPDRRALYQTLKRVKSLNTIPDLMNEEQLLQEEAQAKEAARRAAFVTKMQAECPRGEPDTILELLEYKYEASDEDLVKLEIDHWASLLAVDKLAVVDRLIEPVAKHRGALPEYARDKLKQFKKTLKDTVSQIEDKTKQYNAYSVINNLLVEIFQVAQFDIGHPLQAERINVLYKQLRLLPEIQGDTVASRERTISRLRTISAKSPAAQAVLCLELKEEALMHAKQGNLVALYACAKQAVKDKHGERALTLYFMFLVAYATTPFDDLKAKYNLLADEFADWCSEAQTYLKTIAALDDKTAGKEKYLAEARVLYVLQAWLQQRQVIGQVTVPSEQLFAFGLGLVKSWHKIPERNKEIIRVDELAGATITDAQVKLCQSHFRNGITHGVGYDSVWFDSTARDWQQRMLDVDLDVPSQYKKLFETPTDPERVKYLQAQMLFAAAPVSVEGEDEGALIEVSIAENELYYLAPRG